MRAAVLALFGCALFSCSDEIPVRSPQEDYTREFVKEFGEFKGESWSEAVSGALTVRTSHPTPVKVYAEIDGERFLFADLGSVNGTQPIIVNVPRSVKELIVRADGVEYKTALGKVLDLTEQGRVICDMNFSPVTTRNGFKVNYDKKNDREIAIMGDVMKKHYLENFLGRLNDPTLGFEFENAEHNFSFKNDAGLYNNGYYIPLERSPYITLYPIYWRENRYGESDYLLGVYFFNENEPNHIEMHDLEDFDIKSSVRTTKDFENFTVGEGKAYDPKALNSSMAVDFKGAHIKFENVEDSFDASLGNVCVGFYIKSGLKDTYTEGKGRDYTHITFQTLPGNAMEWGENFWDVPLGNADFAYSGCMASSVQSTVSGSLINRMDGLRTSSANVDHSFNHLGFTSQPDGVDASKPDFCDVVFLVARYNNSLHRNLVHSGEGEAAYPWYLAAEDLGTVDDWDFNDLIVNISDITTDLSRPYTQIAKTTPDGKEHCEYPTPNVIGRRIIVEPRAAGGTMPIYLMYDGEIAKVPGADCAISDIMSLKYTDGSYMIGKELHAWLGEPDYTKMLNTYGNGDEYKGRAVSFCVPIAKKGTDNFDPLAPPQNVGVNNQTMRGFWVLVDKDNALAGELQNPELDSTPLEDIWNGSLLIRRQAETEHSFVPFSGRLGDGTYRVDAPINTGGSSAPQMLMCVRLWSWCKERVKISDAYTGFSDWVAGKRVQWHPNADTGIIDEEQPGFYPEKLCTVETPRWKD